jgi:hypothetical protein
MAIRGTAVQTEISAVSGTTKFSLLTEPNGAVGSFHLLEKRNLSQVITSVSDPGVATIVASAGPSDVRVTQISKTPGDIRNEAEFFQDIFQVFSLQPRQRRGSSDFDGIQPLPINTEQFSDDPDPPLNALRHSFRSLMMRAFHSPFAGHLTGDDPRSDNGGWCFCAAQCRL